MGDWHGTCFASSLPIFEGEDCAAILMVRNPYDTRRNTYPDDRYFPITAPLRGKYNGYGGIIPVRDSNYKALEAFIKDYPVLLFAKEQDPSTGIPIQDLSAALDGAIHCGVILNSKEFPTRKGNLVVEMGLLHGKILSFAEKEYSKRIHSVERAIENIEMAAKETSFWSPKFSNAKKACGIRCPTPACRIPSLYGLPAMDTTRRLWRQSPQCCKTSVSGSFPAMALARS